MSGFAQLSVVVPTRDTKEITLRCLQSLRNEAAEAQIVVVDDASGDGTATAVRSAHPGARVLRNERPAGYSAAVNRGVAATNRPLVLLLNSDTEVLGGALRHLVEAFDRFPRLGIAGAALQYPDGRQQWSGGPAPGFSWLAALATGLGALSSGLRSGLRRPGSRTGSERERVDWVTGAAMAVRREVWDAVGPFDERYRFYCQDLDLCLTAKGRGWDVSIVRGFGVVHHHGATIGQGGGTVAHQHPEALWSDLLRWARKARGRSWARLAGLVLWGGTVARLAARRVRALSLPSREREAWDLHSRSYARAARAAFEVALGR